MIETFDIAGYTRISVDDELDQKNISIENQKAIIEDFVKQKFPGSSLTFTGQTARVVNGETVPGWYGNLTFGDADLTAERYDLYTHQ